MALNKYLDRTDKLIRRYKDLFPFYQFQNLEGNPASFDDLIWFYVNPDSGRRSRVATGRHGIKGGGKAGSDPIYALPYPYGELIKIFVIESFNSAVGVNVKLFRVSLARKLLSKMNGHLFQQNQRTIIEHIGDKKISQIMPFIHFCQNNAIIPKINFNFRDKDIRDRTGAYENESKSNKMADEEVIKAIGAIYTKTINSLISGRREPGYLRDAVASFVALLCLASPNRAAAEVFLLAHQEVKSYSELDKPNVYYLDWPGSKGFGDNRNHILRALAPQVKKGMEYFSNEFQPGRIIASYYNNPNQTLRALLGDFPVDTERVKHLDIDSKPNLFQLGYALGFYAVDHMVRVYLEPTSTTKSLSRAALPWRRKPVSAIQGNDLLSSSPFKGSPDGIHALIKTPLTSAFKRFKVRMDGLITVEEIENIVLEFQKAYFPTFPLGFSTGDRATIQMDAALFCVLGSQYYDEARLSKRGGQPRGTSPYIIQQPSTLARCAAGDLGKKGSLFLSHGFPSGYYLNFHQLRHYTNTIADRSGIPNEIITAWSGRKSRDQTHEYIHTSHSEKASRVKSVRSIVDESAPDTSIRWISRDSISTELNLPASATSTGVCTQNLISNPCDFLNDFAVSCFLCPNSCHIAGDKKAIEFLKKDYNFQMKRLNTIEGDPRLAVSKSMKSWFAVHSRNTLILDQLIELMESMPVGAVVSFNDTIKQFNILDIKTRAISHVSAKIDSYEDRLDKKLNNIRKEDSHHSKANSDLGNVLVSFGLSEDI